MFIIETNDKINKYIKYCLYCFTNDRAGDPWKVPIEVRTYNVELTTLTNQAKQCPACKRVYILSS